MRLRIRLIQMIRFKLKELLAEKEFQERRVVTLKEVAEATGIYRTTLTKIANTPSYNTGTDNLDRLCDYFKCPVEKLIEHIPQVGNSDTAMPTK